MFNYFEKFRSSERGQSIAEFAVILPVLMLLLLVPVDLYFYMNTKMILQSAATESLSQVTFADVNSGVASGVIIDTVREYYGDKLDSGRVRIDVLSESVPDRQEYIYHVYSSDLVEGSGGDFQEQFEKRPSSYDVMKLDLQLSYEMRSMTFWGAMFLGWDYDVTTPVYSRHVYVSGYTEP